MNLTQLEVGVEYRTRDGRKIVFTDKERANSLSKWGCKYWLIVVRGDGLSWASDGPHIGKRWSYKTGISMDRPMDVIGL